MLDPPLWEPAARAGDHRGLDDDPGDPRARRPAQRGSDERTRLSSSGRHETRAPERTGPRAPPRLGGDAARWFVRAAHGALRQPWPP